MSRKTARQRPPTKPLQRLLVVSHVIHYRHQGRLFAFGPYAREIDIWADLFAEVVIAAPCRHEAPPGDCLAFSRPNIDLCDQWETGGHTLRAKARQLALLPGLVWGLSRAMAHADAIHVRCPGNLGLLGVLLAPLFSRYRVAKYAGQWNGYSGEPWSNRLQRQTLRSSWWNSPVVVYGQWPGQPPHIIPFFTSMMTDAQVVRAAQMASTKRIELPLRVLFSGRLAEEKRVDILLEAAQLALGHGLSLELALVGDGPERARLQRLAGELGLADRVAFVGALPFDEALAWYQWAHCLVLPSVHSEGWPKVVAEAMCHRVACVAVRHGQLPAMLEDRGILLESGTPLEIADALRFVASEPDQVTRLVDNAATWARQYSLERMRDAIAALLAERWGAAFQRSGTRQPMPFREPVSPLSPDSSLHTC